jgi:acylphosphatase
MTERRRWRFFGRVQGVGFRFFCEEAGRARAVRGWVRNEPDGSVTVEAEADPATLDDLWRHLCSCPPGARVDRSEVSRAEPRNDLTEGFDIR